MSNVLEEGDDLDGPFRNCRYLVVKIYVEGNCNIYLFMAWLVRY
jgi:hypothetical protein